MKALIGILTIGDYFFMAMAMGIAVLISIIGGYDRDEDSEAPASDRPDPAPVTPLRRRMR